MAKYCRICGALLEDDDNFCKSCGTAVITVQQTQQPQNTPPVYSLQGNFAGNTYGNSSQPQNHSSLPQMISPNTSGHYDPNCGNFSAGNNTAAVQIINALPSAGWIDLGGFGNRISDSNTSQRSGQFQQNIPARIPGKLGAILGGIDFLLSGIKNSFRHPKALLSSVVMFAVWMWLRHIDNTGQSTEFTDILSKIVYKGGLDRHGFGGFCSIFGMGAVAAAFSSVFHGGFISAFRGIGKMFSGGFSFGSLLMGTGFSAICYKLLTGGSSDGTAVAVSIAFMALQAVTNSGGFLFNISASHSKMRSPVSGQDIIIASRYGSYLAGMAAGAVAAGILSYRFEYSYLIPIGLILLGTIINGIFKPRIADGRA